METFTLPASIDEIDAAWLEAALRRGVLDLDGVAVSSVRIEPVNAAVNLLGEVARLHPVYAGDAGAVAALPATLIAKLPSSLPENRALGLLMGWYEAEHRFYSDLAADVGLRTPQCWFSGGDAAAERYTLLLEDVGACTRVDQSDGLDVARAGRVVDALASMHAKWWNDPSLDTLGWLPIGYGDAIKVFGDIMRGSWPAFAEATAEVVTDDDRALARRFIDAFDTIVDSVATGPRTLLHRDFRVDNMLFDGDEPVVFDWAGAAVGGPLYDLAYFLGGSLTVDDRRAAWDALVRRYLDALAAGGAAIDAERLAGDLAASALFCLIVPIMTGGDVLDTRNEQGWALTATILRRTFAMLHDLDAGAVIP